MSTRKLARKLSEALDQNEKLEYMLAEANEELQAMASGQHTIDRLLQMNERAVRAEGLASALDQKLGIKMLQEQQTKKLLRFMESGDVRLEQGTEEETGFTFWVAVTPGGQKYPDQDLLRALAKSWDGVQQERACAEFRAAMGGRPEPDVFEQVGQPTITEALAALEPLMGVLEAAGAGKLAEAGRKFIEEARAFDGADAPEPVAPAGGAPIPAEHATTSEETADTCANCDQSAECQRETRCVREDEQADSTGTNTQIPPAGEAPAGS